MLALKKEESEQYTLCVIENIKGFSNSNRYNQRQTFALMSKKLM